MLTDNATISWHGQYEADGCGFFVQIEGRRYKASNEELIGDEFKTLDDSASVQLEYTILPNKIVYSCHDAPWPYEIDGIEIISIQAL